jgi:hypothetical protein
MSSITAGIRGIVRGGVIVLEPPGTLPEGAAVEVKLTAIDRVHPEDADSTIWESLSDEAWSQIDWGEGDIARDSG